MEQTNKYTTELSLQIVDMSWFWRVFDNQSRGFVTDPFYTLDSRVLIWRILVMIIHRRLYHLLSAVEGEMYVQRLTQPCLSGVYKRWKAYGSDCSPPFSRPVSLASVQRTYRNRMARIEITSFYRSISIDASRALVCAQLCFSFWAIIRFETFSSSAGWIMQRVQR